ncbi:hypothetical protein NPIL_6631 [Nephila pilipes]|uniref:Uncharacterized protein n=1 Tax=Nephila pilipes TaxID=299642 RepID=A0A8X6UCT3_NEPPI|nr:hypothetical protein NPIL_6631 [Nephila pilipes]
MRREGKKFDFQDPGRITLGAVRRRRSYLRSKSGSEFIKCEENHNGGEPGCYFMSFLQHLGMDCKGINNQSDPLRDCDFMNGGVITDLDINWASEHKWR